MDDEAPTRPWHIHISWYAVILAGVLLYEMTAQPGLAAAVTCSKFGWRDWRVALWLRRVDPDWKRGRTCFWFYLSFGLWKVALLATLMMMLLLLAMSPGCRVLPGGNKLSPAIVGVLTAAGLGFGCSFLLTYLGMALALRHRVKVWLGLAPVLARQQRYWPPEGGQHNAAPFVIITTLILTLWLALVGMALLAAQFGRARGGVVGLIALTFLALASPATLIVLKYLEGRIFARSPAECWPADDVGCLSEEGQGGQSLAETGRDRT